MTIQEWLTLKGWKVSQELVDGDRERWARIRRCPMCGDDHQHFYVSLDTGHWKCHKCGKGGTFLRLKELQGDIADVKPITPPATETTSFSSEEVDQIMQAHRALLDDGEVLRYLGSRKITTECIRYFKLGVMMVDGVKWLVIPFLSKGKLKGAKMRSLPPAKKQFRRLLGGVSSLFNEDILSDSSVKEIILTEGELDCLALWSAGVRNVVGVTVGASGFKSEWIDLLDRFQKVYFAYDSDPAGRVGANKFATRLGIERCYDIRLPPIRGVKDVNDFFKAGRKTADFLSLMERAEKFDVEYVQSVGGLVREHLYRMQVSTEEDKLHLPWKNVDGLMDGMAPGDLIVVGGRPAVGKTTFVLNILWHIANMGIPALLFELEMRPHRLLPKFASLCRKLPTPSLQDIEMLSSVLEEMKNIPLYIAYKYDRPSWEFVADTIRMCIRRYGIRLLVFDNLHFMCRSLTKQTEEVSMMMQNFKLLAEELAIPIILVARPRKTQAKFISGEDLKDSADIEGDSDYIILIHREKKKIDGQTIEGRFEPETLVILDKARWSKGGSTMLRCLDELALFEEMKTF